MLILRFFLLVQAYHWATFYKQRPLAFFIGVLLFPWHLISRLAYPPSEHAEVVSNGIKGLKSYWEIPGATLPPKCLRRRLLALESEVDSL